MDNSSLLNDRIGRLKEWEDKESLNELLFNALSSMNAYIKERFDGLTQEISNELPLNDDSPIIKTAVCLEEDVGKQLFLCPVSTEPPMGCPGYVATVFAECGYRAIQELMGRTYPAEIRRGKQTVKARVGLRYSLKYLQKLESLYYMFSENETPWETANAVYFYKFLDAYIVADGVAGQNVGGLSLGVPPPGGAGGTSNANAGGNVNVGDAHLGVPLAGATGVASNANAGDAIDSFTIDFSPYEKQLSFGKTLLWNISPLALPVSACDIRPAFNAVQYEHTLKSMKPDGHVYLICPVGCKFTGFRRGQTMFVRTYGRQFEQFKLLRVSQGEDMDSPLCLPTKTNRKRGGTLEALARKQYIPTRGEAERIVYSLGEGSDLRLADMKVLPHTVKNIMKYKGLDFNYFVEANGFLTGKKFLLFTFEVGESKTWAHETMYYALSELQRYFYEYRCVGEMI